jgi:polysaccharide biosynthesis transport protein
MDQPTTNDSGLDLREYLHILRSRKWTIAVTAVLIVAAVLGFSFLQEPLYSAQARVLVQPLASPGSIAGQPVDVQTESQVARSQPVAEQVQAELDTTISAKSLQGSLDVTGVSATQVSYSSAQVLVFTFTSSDPVFARDAANTFADAYIQYRKQQALGAFVSAQSSVQQRIKAASKQLEDVTRQLEEATRAGDQSLILTLETQRGVFIARLGVLQQRLDDLQPDETVRTGGAQVIDSALTPTSPSSPDFFRNGALALVGGLILGIGAAFLRERLDDRFRGRADVEVALGAPVLGTVPKYRISKRGHSGFGLVAPEEGKSLATEAYRTLRTNLEFALSQHGVRGIVVTSPSSGEGKTATTANLGVVLAQAGRRVILVSADLRRPTLEKYFKVKNEKGLSTFLRSRAHEPWSFLQDPGIPNMRLMTAGPIPDNPAELLTSARLSDMIRKLEANCDILLIDSPPALAVADSALLAARAGGAIVVIDAGATHRSAAVHAKEEVERGGGVVLGSILNAFDPSASPYYYASYYSSGYASASDVSTANGDSRTRKVRSQKRAKSLFGFRR